MASPHGFGDILDAWERGSARRSGAQAGKGELPSDAEERAARARAKARLEAMRPERTLDLHGMDREQAAEAVQEFILRARADGLEKIALVTGKGRHSVGGGVLKALAMDMLARNRFVESYEEAPREAGGTGALWIVLRASPAR
jgi:DNA-nicking Smr family endonuclease